MFLHDILKWLLANICFDARFMCFSWFVAFCVTFNDLCCWTQRCGLLSRMQLRLTNQSSQTSPNEFVLHFEVVFLISWHQIRILVRLVTLRFCYFYSNYSNFCHKFVYWWHWTNSSNYQRYFACTYTILLKDCWQRFVSMLHLCVCRDLLHFVSLLTICVVEPNVVAYRHPHI